MLTRPPLNGLTARTRQDAGMSLRDYFAAKALAGIASTYHENWTPESAAKNAYELADAMLAERSRATGAAS
ncbi:MAG TPA: hypothetical protein PLB26_19845 [Rubrivivax sp.]|nr:hypothetical protein [Rubrivivax sp.]